ncbi:hypothetical protein JOQ06_001650, partial [Pogonophryne albipinna]
MENDRVPVLPQDNQTGRRVSARQRRPAVCRQCPCCRDDQVPHTKRRRPAASADLPQKRKQTSAALPPKPADLPPVSNVASSPRTSTAPLHLEDPIRIHNRSVEEYQLIYHEVVDNMLRFPGGRLRPYSLGLGRRIKQKLWERLDRPMFTETVDEDGLVHVDVSYGAGVQPPLYNVDVSVFLIQLQPQQQQLSAARTPAPPSSLHLLLLPDKTSALSCSL